MQTVTTCKSCQSYTIPSASELGLPNLKKPELVPVLIKTLDLFQEIADCLISDEQEQTLRATYRYLHANCLLLSERIKIFQETGSSAALNPFAGLILKKFYSLLRTSDGALSPGKQAAPSDLDALYERWGELTSREEKVLYIVAKIHLDGTNCWDALVTFLEECVDALDDPDTSTTEARRVHPKGMREPPSNVYIAARAMFNALTKTIACSCEPCHEYAARMKLATYRKPPKIDDQYSFELLLSSSDSYWQEALIQSTLPQKKSEVKIAIDEQPARKRRRGHRMPVYRLCEHIRSRSPAYCLNLEVEDGNVWKFRSSDSRLCIGNDFISLEEIVRRHPTNLSEKVKRVLAVLVGHCFLQLHGTSWLQPGFFNTSRIIFFRIGTLLPLRPFIHLAIDPDVSSSGGLSTADESDEFMDPDDLPLHSQPNLVMLAIMLIELYMGKPVYELAQSSSFAMCAVQTIDENSRYRLATEAFQRCGSEFTDNYRLAIATCLDLDFGLDADDNELQVDQLKDLVYREIVQCLEDELEQGFGQSMPIDNLDEAAPTLNLNMWKTMDLISLEDADIRLSMDLRGPESVLTMRSRQTTSIEWDQRGSQCAIATGRETTECHINSAVTHHELTHHDYNVGWICALAEEMAAARAMLDEEHPSLPQDLRADNNNYVLGRIGSHNIVLACLPSGVTGTTSAAVVANRMRSTFQGLRFGLMVGIGGAAPSETDDVRLGDVVVGTPHGRYSGVVQYDFGKTIEEGRLMITSALNRAPNIVLTAVSNLKSQHFLLGHQIQLYLQKMVEQYPRLKANFSHPGAENDLLYQSDHNHASKNRTCTSCDSTKTIPRKPRDTTEPVIHYGLIASGNQVMKDAITRDRLKHDLDILCFEMEAAGLVNDFPCLVIRGISDYADSHKNDMWRYYAAATAAAYAKELLNSMPADRVANESTRT
ncbi:hypothetical protein BJX68DRAFT_277842 [Aspergillus pseudodeflectus]|uniref:Nucleoside phosphorylase domain-containing protein n=1 Tax=Aspergillus pseudodeflectus TaxID=176178 RepID=A0ABR4JXC9_9EURO